MCLCTRCIKCPWRPEKGSGTSGTRVTDGCEPPCIHTKEPESSTHHLLTTDSTVQLPSNGLWRQIKFLWHTEFAELIFLTVKLTYLEHTKSELPGWLHTHQKIGKFQTLPENGKRRTRGRWFTEKTLCTFIYFLHA